MIATDLVSEGDTSSRVVETSCLKVLGLDVDEGAVSASSASELIIGISDLPWSSCSIAGGCR